MRTCITALITAVVLPPSSAQHMNEVMIYPADNLNWHDRPASLPKGAKFAVLEGDPAKEGLFALRVKVPDGYRVPPHAHTKSERITVLSGTFNIGMSDKFDETKGGTNVELGTPFE